MSSESKPAASNPSEATPQPAQPQPFAVDASQMSTVYANRAKAFHFA